MRKQTEKNLLVHKQTHWYSSSEYAHCTDTLGGWMQRKTLFSSRAWWYTGKLLFKKHCCKFESNRLGSSTFILKEPIKYWFTLKSFDVIDQMNVLQYILPGQLTAVFSNQNKQRFTSIALYRSSLFNKARTLPALHQLLFLKVACLFFVQKSSRSLTPLLYTLLFPQQ